MGRDGLVGDSGDPALEQPVGELRHRREVQIREEDLSFAQHLDFRGERFFDFDNHFRRGDDLVCRRQNRGARRDIFFVRDTASEPCVVLDQDFVSGRPQGP